MKQACSSQIAIQFSSSLGHSSCLISVCVQHHEPSTCRRHRQWHWLYKNGVCQAARVLADIPFRFAGNDSPSFVFPTAIATRQSAGGPSNRPAPPSKPSFLTSGAGSGGNLAHKRGTDDLDFFIGDEAIQANSGAGYGIDYPIKHGVISDWSLMERFRNTSSTI